MENSGGPEMHRIPDKLWPKFPTVLRQNVKYQEQISQGLLATAADELTCSSRVRF